jgi:signal transduction histidine kinase
MYAETLQMGRTKNEAQRQEYYGTMLAETERLTRLVNNMLNFSRMEAGKKHYEMRNTDVNALVRGVVDTYAAHLHSQGFTVSVVCADRLPDVSADNESIAESLINILDNAIKYSPMEKSVRVSTGWENGNVYVEVEDHGMGIPADQQEKIFEKFYRVSSALVHNTKGSGLGLALVKYIMEAHGGTVSVRSTPAKGSAFRMSFPVHGSHRDGDAERTT